MNYQLWDEYRGRIKSRKGGWRIGEQVVSHGYDLMQELVGKVSYMQVIVLNATGRMPNAELAQWFEAIHICLSWPDPRIWCNRIGALGGSARISSVAATCAGVMAADSSMYGIKPLVEGVEFIQRARANVLSGTTVKNFVEAKVAAKGGKPHLMGYARPIAKGDERVGAMRKVEKELGFSVGEHLAIALEVEQVLHSRFDESMNINGYMSAFLSDQGFNAEEVYRIFSVLVFSGVTACYTDSADRPAKSFAPFRVEDVRYRGKPHRELT